MFSIPTPQKASKGESSSSCLWITERPISMYQSETDQGPVFFKHVPCNDFVYLTLQNSGALEG